MDNTPDTTVVLGRILNERNSKRAHEALNKIPNARVKILFEVHLETFEVVQKKAAYALFLVQQAFNELATEKNKLPEEIDWKDISEIMTRARKLAKYRSEGFFNCMDDFLEFVKYYVPHPYQSLAMVNDDILRSSKERYKAAFGIIKMDDILIADLTKEEEGLRLVIDELLRKNAPSLCEENRSRDLKIVGQLFACSKKAHESTLNFIVIEKQLGIEMPMIISILEEQLKDEIGIVKVQKA